MLLRITTRLGILLLNLLIKVFVQAIVLAIAAVIAYKIILFLM